MMKSVCVCFMFIPHGFCVAFGGFMCLEKSEGGRQPMGSRLDVLCMEAYRSVFYWLQ